MVERRAASAKTLQAGLEQAAQGYLPRPVEHAMVGLLGHHDIDRDAAHGREATAPSSARRAAGSTASPRGSSGGLQDIGVQDHEFDLLEVLVRARGDDPCHGVAAGREFVGNHASSKLQAVNIDIPTTKSTVM